MEKQLHKTMEAAHVERAIRVPSPDKEKEKSHKHRGIFHLHLHHHSKDEKEEDKKKDGSKILAKKKKRWLKERKDSCSDKEGGQEEEEDGGDEEEEDSGDEEEEDSGDEEGGGKFSAFISVIAEAFEE
ncbi:hypothetical protein IGI04_008305 [Brassica rapa subsp. trilocularis]|uniref:Uncharacterized protein n=1 Tax=Brassica rapa subsp. trilocularis TaxID=1813537 RepID=A0ABQ7NND3_BRACM|nr:hypothetical protein IGI04_008305 [Brassica rapa subsp. trilocularis]